MTIDTMQVTKGEFEYLYNKNHREEENAFTEESIREYLDLFINFKLKVYAAYEQGRHLDSAFIQEFQSYQTQLQEPYLTGKRFAELQLENTYERMKYEVNASHILLAVNDSNPEDKALQTISEIQERLDAGEEFEALAKQYSQDPSVKRNGGNLGYFTAMQMVYPFEKAAFETKVGQVSSPVKTRFGYHLIKVHDRRPNQGRVKVAHIMLRGNNEQTKAQADALYEQLQKGAEWEALCKQYSQDRGSADKGGVLPWISSGRVDQSFSEAAFGLEQAGAIAKPIQTPYGWHIIRLIEKEGVPPLEEVKDQLLSQISREGSRTKESMSLLIDTLMQENNYLLSEKYKAKAQDAIDTTILSQTWEINEKWEKTGKKAIFSINGEPTAVQEYWAYVTKAQQDVPAMPIDQLKEKLFEDFRNETILTYERVHLAQKYPEYKWLLKEYHDGILLFKVMEDEVWNQASKDETGLELYFQNYQDQFYWPERLKVTVYDAGSPEILEKVKGALTEGRYEVYPTDVARLRYRRGASSLSSSQRRDLKKVSDMLKSYTALEIVLQGEYVPRESASIANKRVKAIQQQLKRYGVDENRIKVVTPVKVAAAGRSGGQVTCRYYSYDLEQLENSFNKQNALALKITKGTYMKGESSVIDKVTWQKGAYTVPVGDRFHYVVVDKVVPPQPKTLKEAKGEVIAQYQEFLEEQWINSLKSRVEVMVKEEVLQSVIKE
ncbi:hypothetical protein GCM10023331_39890 [Algivirga pacifica]|uniref:PpiC domain-containing protein n=2 Tax=Algivirga pacifica TaxID=1162670 RepID=A0ABP9DQ00_9BACT